MASSFEGWGFLFDLDGVLVDTAKFHYEAWKYLADKLSIPFSKEDNEKLKGISRRDSLEKLLSMGTYIFSEKEKQKMMHQKNVCYIEKISKMDKRNLLPGAIYFLDNAKAKGISCALASASKNARLVLEKTGIANYFEVVIDGNAVTKTKPDPEVFLKAAYGINIRPEKCIVFEDSQAGVEGGIKAHMKVIGIGDEKNVVGAHGVVKTLDEISFSWLRSRIGQI